MLNSLVKAHRACGNRHRLRMLKLIVESRTPVRQKELVTLLKIPQFLAARYLQSLTEAGLIERLRKGIPVLYRLPRPASPAQRRILRLIQTLPKEDFGITDAILEKRRNP